jgi:hypothetical protein
VKVTDPGNYSQDWWLENWGIPTLHDRAQLLPPPPPPALKRKQLAVKKNDDKKAKAEPRRGRKRRPTDEAAATEEDGEAAAGGMIKILKVEGGAVEQVVIKQEVMEEEGGAVLEDFPISELSRLEMSPFEGTKSYMCAFCPKRYVKKAVFRRIRKFLGLPDPDPDPILTLIICTDPIPDSFLNKKKNSEKLRFFHFCDFLRLVVFED